MTRLLFLAALLAASSRVVGATDDADQQPIYVNVGGPDYMDRYDNIWKSDKDLKIYNNGRAYNSYHKSFNPIEATEQFFHDIFETERWSSSSPLKFEIDVKNGKYLVYLLFAEIYFAAAGKRIFDASIEGSPAWTGLDIFDQAGGGFRALTKSLKTTVKDGAVTIQLDKVTQNPKLNGIVVYCHPLESIDSSWSTLSITRGLHRLSQQLQPTQCSCQRVW